MLPGGEAVNTLSWTVTGPNGATSVVKQGTVNVQGSSAINFQIGNIPAASGYTLTLSATSVDGNVTCAGSASFSVTGHATTSISVVMTCNAGPGDGGNANVGAQLVNCGTAGAIAASPSELSVGGTTTVMATATAPNPATITYAWSAPSGIFSSPTSATTDFTCTTTGPVTLTLTVGDGPVPDAGMCNMGRAQNTVQVQCDPAQEAGAPDATTDATGPSACSLGPSGAIKHVIYIQFDNTHLSRDNASVPSDLEQMPHLLSFIRNNGTMMANDHTVLISHTGVGILSSLTGMYPDRHGQTVSNSYVRTNPSGSFSFPSSFGYWTDTATSSTTVPNMVAPDGSNTAAPWVAYTRAGCDFGGVAAANLELENTSTATGGDVYKVFGTGSPQFTEAQSSNSAASGSAARQLAATDLEGIAVHCAQGSSTCASGEADLLPQEPGGYTGYNGLFGTKQIDPVLTGTGDASVALTDMLGNPIVDQFGQPGFPGFDGMSAAVSLAYIAAMQEHGIPVTYAYISDAHDNHGTNGSGQVRAYGPGEAAYVAQLAAYDQAFANFFTRLANDGIDKTNTLFVFTVDEGDHFVGSAATPAGCDGVNTPCTYANIGEINANIDTLVTNEFPSLASTFLSGPNAFTVHGDDAPTFYLSRKSGDAGPIGPLGQTDPDTRNFERNIATLTAVNSYTGNTDTLLYRMADQAGMQALHMMTTGDPARNPTFVLFANDDYYITDFPSSTCLTCIVPKYAWNHGDDQSVIGQTWMGLVGPGIKNQADQTVFTDHTDLKPTIDSVLGIHDSYVSDGRVITQALQSTAYSSALGTNLSTMESLGDEYKQINAPFGPFAACILTASTTALQASDTYYASIESSIASLTGERDALATSIKNALDGCEFHGTAIDPTQASTWISSAQSLLASCNSLVASLPVLDAGAPEASTSDAGGPVDSGSPVDSGAPADAGTTSDSGSGVDAGALANLVVYRVGDGSGALTGSATPVFLDTFTAGTLSGTLAAPTAASGSNHMLTASGTATSEGLITQSTNGKYVLLTGYDTAVGTASITTSASASINRVVGRLDALGNLDTTTALNNAFSAGNPRSVTSDDGVELWLSGSNGGVLYASIGNTATTATIATSTTNLRQIDIFGGQLCVTSASGSLRLGAVGSGLPTASTTITGLTGFPTSGGSPYGFFFADLDGMPGVDTLYVADDSAALPGGLTKYSLVSGTWTSNGTVDNASAASYRGLAGTVSGTTVTLYTTRKGSELAVLVDSSGYNQPLSGTPTLLATAPTNTAFRGVALAPTP
jgi:hypothetical protein